MTDSSLTSAVRIYGLWCCTTFLPTPWRITRAQDTSQGASSLLSMLPFTCKGGVLPFARV